MRLGSREPGRGECRFVIEKTFRTRPIFMLSCWLVASRAQWPGFSFAAQCHAQHPQAQILSCGHFFIGA